MRWSSGGDRWSMIGGALGGSDRALRQRPCRSSALSPSSLSSPPIAELCLSLSLSLRLRRSAFPASAANKGSVAGFRARGAVVRCRCSCSPGLPVLHRRTLPTPTTLSSLRLSVYNAAHPTPSVPTLCRRLPRRAEHCPVVPDVRR